MYILKLVYKRNSFIRFWKAIEPHIQMMQGLNSIYILFIFSFLIENYAVKNIKAEGEDSMAKILYITAHPNDETQSFSMAEVKCSLRHTKK
jgi:hypothetical protein